MADSSPRSPDATAGRGVEPDRDPIDDPGTPRWVKAFAVVAIVFVLAFAVLHLVGRGFRGHG